MIRAAATAVAAAAALLAWESSAGAATVPRVILRVPVPSAGEVTFARYDVGVVRARGAWAPAGPARVLSRVPADVSATLSYTTLRGRRSVRRYVVAMARRRLARGARPAAVDELDFRVRAPRGAAFVPLASDEDRDLLRKVHPLRLPRECANSLSNPYVSLPRRLLGAPTRYVHPWPRLSAGGFQTQVWSAYCWRPLDASFYGRLTGTPPYQVTGRFQHLGQDGTGVTFTLNRPAAGIGAWVAPPFQFTQAFGGPGLDSLRIVDSQTASWKTHTYIGAIQPLEPNREYQKSFDVSPPPPASGNFAEVVILATPLTRGLTPVAAAQVGY